MAKKSKKKRPGRPKLESGKDKGFMLRIRMTEAMRNSLNRAAKRAGVTMSEFTRQLIALKLDSQEDRG